jgi:pimeloyl-ACP methyl ester carboxylesterase
MAATGGGSIERLAIVGDGAAASTVLVLHGGPGESHDPLRPHLDRLAAPSRRLVYYDQRAAPAGFREHVADVEEVRRRVGAERVALLGFSWGALLALLYALERRERVSALVLLSPTLPGASAPPEAGERPGMDALRRALAARDQAAARFALRVAPSLYDPLRALELRPAAIAPGAAEAVRASLAGLDLAPRLPSLRAIPTLVVRGADDPAPAAPARAIADALGAELLLIPRCGHAPFLEGGEPFFRACAAFLDGAC